MSTKIIEVTGIKKAFKQNKVLTDVSFSVERGEIFALLGSNGAGKTTMIKILSTLLKADEGKSVICNLDVEKEPQSVKENISLTGQFAAVDEILTGRENLILIGKLRHIKKPKEKADELLLKLGLGEAGDRRVGTYSGGMRRRLDIAMSFVGNPKVIFLDEPTTGLDPEARMEVWKEIRRLSQNGTTIFLTTQYLEEAEQLADHIAILHKGTIIANGTLGELKKMFPPKKLEYIEKQPSLEEIFLSITKAKGENKND